MIANRDKLTVFMKTYLFLRQRQVGKRVPFPP